MQPEPFFSLKTQLLRTFTNKPFSTRRWRGEDAKFDLLRCEISVDGEPKLRSMLMQTYHLFCVQSTFLKTDFYFLKRGLFSYSNYDRQQFRLMMKSIKIKHCVRPEKQSLVGLSPRCLVRLFPSSLPLNWNDLHRGGGQGGLRPILVSIGRQFEVLQGCKRRTCRVKLLAGDHS